MKQVVVLQWYPIEFGEMPSEEGTYLVAWDDGSVESYPMDINDIKSGSIRSGSIHGVYWAENIHHPDE